MRELPGALAGHKRPCVRLRAPLRPRTDTERQSLPDLNTPPRADKDLGSVVVNIGTDEVLNGERTRGLLAREEKKGDGRGGREERGCENQNTFLDGHLLRRLHTEELCLRLSIGDRALTRTSTVILGFTHLPM